MTTVTARVGLPTRSLVGGPMSQVSALGRHFPHFVVAMTLLARSGRFTTGVGISTLKRDHDY
jgi:hypothetical protein